MRDYDVMHKNTVRDALLGTIEGVYRKPLMLTGPQMLDVKILLRRGNVTKAGTEPHVIERDKESAALIRPQLSALFDRSRLWHHDLKDLALEGKSTSKHDLLYLDSCGELASSLFPMIRSIPAGCTPDPFVAFTFSVNGRNRSFYESCWEYFFGGAIGSEIGPERASRYKPLRRTLHESPVFESLPSCPTAIYDKAILTATILETLTDGKTEQLYVYRDTSFYMATCKVKISCTNRRCPDFLTWLEQHKAGLDAAKTKAANAGVVT